MLSIGITRDAAFPVLCANVQGLRHLLRDAVRIQREQGRTAGLDLRHLAQTRLVRTDGSVRQLFLRSSVSRRFAVGSEAEVRFGRAGGGDGRRGFGELS